MSKSAAQLLYRPVLVIKYTEKQGKAQQFVNAQFFMHTQNVFIVWAEKSLCMCGGEKEM